MERSKAQILVLDVHGPYEPWLSILNEGQLKTWAVDGANESLEVIHAMGRPVGRIAHNVGEFLYSLKFSKPKQVGIIALGVDYMMKKVMGNYIPKIRETRDEIHGYKKWDVLIPDYALLMGNKMMAVFKFALENSDFDFFATTITSTYLNTNELVRFVETLPKEKMLAGNFVTRGQEHFQQGAFRLYSRDVVEYIVQNRKCYQHWALEDVAMGRLLNKKGFNEFRIPNTTIASITELDQLDYEFVQKQVYFRCKGVTKFGNKLREDVSILKAVHDRISTQN